MENRIIFCGDLVLPYNANIDISKIEPLFKNAIGIANLEGAILKSIDNTNEYNWGDKFSLYSSPKVIDLIKKLNP